MIIHKLPTREEGQGLVEYALILVLVAVVVIAILLQLGPEIGKVFSRVTFILESGGGTSGLTITMTGTPSVGKSSSGPSCTYSASASVQATQDGLPAENETINGTVTVKNGGGATVTFVGITGATDGSGNATLSGSTPNQPCAGAQATVAIAGGPSQDVTIP